METIVEKRGLRRAQHNLRSSTIVSSLEVWTCIHPVVGVYPSDIASSLDLAHATVSHHLAVLEEAGLFRHVRQGRNRLYQWTGESWAVVSAAEVEAMMVEQQIEEADQVPT